MSILYNMYCLTPQKITLSKTKTSTISRKYNKNVVVCSQDFKVNDIIEKRKEVDKIRMERIKEIGNTLDHIVKSEVKQSVKIMTEVMPFLKKINGIEKFIGKNETTPNKPTTTAPKN
jgi:hypothetical protein